MTPGQWSFNQCMRVIEHGTPGQWSFNQCMRVIEYGTTGQWQLRRCVRVIEHDTWTMAVMPVYEGDRTWYIPVTGPKGRLPQSTLMEFVSITGSGS